MTDAIVTDRLTKHYHGRRVVDSLSLRVPAGSVYGLLGRNGAGKSTAIKMLMGMVRPDSGSATLLGEDIAAITPATRQRIAYLAEGHPLYGWMTIGQAVEFTRAFYPRWNDTLVDQILDHFELSRKQKFRRLSRGQQAQVSLALAVAPDPELLVLDDPDARPGHGRAARLPRVADPDHPAARPHDPVQLAHPGRRRTRGRPHRHHDRRRAAGRLPHRDLPRIGPQDRARVRRHAARIGRSAGPGELPASSATHWNSCWSATTTPSAKPSNGSGRSRSKCST